MELPRVWWKLGSVTHLQEDGSETSLWIREALHGLHVKVCMENRPREDLLCQEVMVSKGEPQWGHRYGRQ